MKGYYSSKPKSFEYENNRYISAMFEKTNRLIPPLVSTMEIGITYNSTQKQLTCDCCRCGSYWEMEEWEVKEHAPMLIEALKEEERTEEVAELLEVFEKILAS
jgi:hypothetical protein